MSELTLTDFLLARIAEDEEVARSAALDTGDRGFGDERIDSGKEWVPSYHMVCRQRVLPDQGKRVILEGAALGLAVAKHVALHDPERVLAEVEAKRQIAKVHESLLGDPYGQIKDQVVYWCAECDHDRDYNGIPHEEDGCPTLRHLAAVYADHPDYRAEWRP